MSAYDAWYLMMFLLGIVSAAVCVQGLSLGH
jgi:hypothetical protein